MPGSLQLSGSRKRGVECKGVAFVTVWAVLTVLAVLESTLPSFCLSYKIQHNEATVAVLRKWMVPTKVRLHPYGILCHGYWQVYIPGFPDVLLLA